VLGTLATLASIARIHIVAIGALGTLTFAWALCGTRPWLLAALCASDWFVVNLLNRVVDLKEDAANHIRGTALVARHRRAVLAVGFGALALSFLATALLAPALLPFRVAFHALGFAYNWPLLPLPARRASSVASGLTIERRRIKELAFWKNAASATGFVLTVLCYPLAIYSTKSDVSFATLLAAALFFFLFELSYEVLYDLRDVEGDRLAGVRTWPVLFGVHTGWRIAAALMIASFVVIAVAYAAGLVPWRLAIMGAAPLLQLAVASRMVARPGGVTTGDCVAITWLGAALLAAYHLWEALGLPGASA
jgi:4-hydroxybenzoate polyprenyltransferase